MACCSSCEKGDKCEGKGCTGKIEAPANHVQMIKPYRWKYAFTFAKSGLGEEVIVKGTKQQAYYKMKGTSSPYQGLGAHAKSATAWPRQPTTLKVTHMFERRQMSQLCRTGGDRIQ